MNLQRLGSLLWAQLAVHKRILNTRVLLDEPVLSQLEVEVLEFVHCEGMVVPTMEVADLCLLLGDARRWPRARVGVSGLQAKLGRMHVVLLLPFHWCRGEGPRPPEKCAQHNIARVVDIEHVLPRDKVLCPEVLPERRAAVVRNLEGTVKAPALLRYELVRVDVPLEGSNDPASGAR